MALSQETLDLIFLQGLLVSWDEGLLRMKDGGWGEANVRGQGGYSRSSKAHMALNQISQQKPSLGLSMQRTRLLAGEGVARTKHGSWKKERAEFTWTLRLVLHV